MSNEHEDLENAENTEETREETQAVETGESTGSTKLQLDKEPNSEPAGEDEVSEEPEAEEPETSEDSDDSEESEEEGESGEDTEPESKPRAYTRRTTPNERKAGSTRASQPSQRGAQAGDGKSSTSSRSSKVKKPRKKLELPKISRKTWLKIIGGIAGVVVLIAAMVLAFPIFKVKDIEVTGNSHLSQDDVTNASGVRNGDNLARVSTQKAASNVAGNAWVKQATVDRHLPSTVTIDVQERKPVAWIDDNGKQSLIDDSGDAFVDDTPPPGALRINNIDRADSARLSEAIAIAASISHVDDATAKKIESVNADGPHTYTLTLGDNRTVKWGTSTDNENKARAVKGVLAREAAGQDAVEEPENSQTKTKAGKVKDFAPGDFDVTNPNLVSVK